MPPPIATPADTPYPGTITLDGEFDGYDGSRGESARDDSVKAGELTLLYPAVDSGQSFTDGADPEGCGAVCEGGWEEHPVGAGSCRRLCVSHRSA